MTDRPDPIAAARGARIETEAQDWLLAAMADHGAWVLFVICLASCLALPVPASLAMISAGAIAAAGEMTLGTIALACLAGAIVGDQLAFLIGRAGRGPLIRWVDAKPARKEARLRAEAWIDTHGGPGVLISRWPVSPLGPYVNFAAGAAAYRWPRFLGWSAGGECLWVGVNLGLGYVFADQITGVALMLQEATGIVLAVICVAAIIWALRHMKNRTRD